MLDSKSYAARFKEHYDYVHRTHERHSIRSFFDTLSLKIDNPDWAERRLIFFLDTAGYEAKRGNREMEFFFVPAMSRNDNIEIVTKNDLTAMYLYLKHEGFAFDREFKIFDMHTWAADKPINQFYVNISWA